MDAVARTVAPGEEQGEAGAADLDLLRGQDQRRGQVPTVRGGVPVSMYPEHKLPLFDVARSHKHDPATSHEAARRMNASGRARTNADRVYAAIEQWPDRTSGELVSLCEGCDLAEVRRRITDLKRAGLIEPTGARLCRSLTTRQTTWGVCRGE